MSEKSTVPKPLPPIIRKSLESGLITLSAVSENRRPETSVTESVNFDFDQIGSATIRKGTTQLGNTLSGNILGIYYFVDSVNASPKSQLIVVNGTSAYYLNSNTFTAIRNGLSSNNKARFVTFLNYVFMVNGADATAVWDGNTAGSFSTIGNALSAPIGKYIENFRSRVWIAGNSTYPDRLYYSSIPSSVVTPVITWDTSVATGQWIDISPSDGESITALHRSRNTLIVLKTNHLYRVFDISQNEPDAYYAVGTSSQESIVETKVGMFFHHSSGFYQYNVYGMVQEISQPIIDIVRAIPSSNYAKVAGWLDPDGNHINWSVGNVTYKGITYSNLVLRFTISTQTWTHRSYPTQFLVGLAQFPLYTDGTTQFQIVGDTAGKVYEYNTGTTDAGTAISYSLVHRWDNIDGLLSTRKTIQTGVFTHQGGAGSNISYQVEDDINGFDGEVDWSKSAGQLHQFDTGINTMNIKGRKVRFRISGSSSGQQFSYNGYELIGVINEFLQFS